MSLIRTISLTAFAALLVVGCGKKNDADKYLDQMDQATTEAMNLIKEKKPKTPDELMAMPEWKAIEAKGTAADSALKTMADKLTPEQKKRLDEINKRGDEIGKQMMSMAPAPTPTPAPTGGDTAAAAPSTTAPAPHDTAAHAAPADTAHK